MILSGTSQYGRKITYSMLSLKTGVALPSKSAPTMTFISMTFLPFSKPWSRKAGTLTRMYLEPSERGSQR